MLPKGVSHYSLKVLYLSDARWMVIPLWNTGNLHLYKSIYCWHYTYTLEKHSINHLHSGNSCLACFSGYHIIMFIYKY